jgi:hypothetical protein
MILIERSGNGDPLRSLTTNPYMKTSFVDTTEKEMYSDYPSSIIEDDVSKMISDNDRSSCVLSPFCGISKEIMSRGLQVADMECRETT